MCLSLTSSSSATSSIQQQIGIMDRISTELQLVSTDFFLLSPPCLGLTRFWLYYFEVVEFWLAGTRTRCPGSTLWVRSDLWQVTVSFFPWLRKDILDELWVACLWGRGCVLNLSDWLKVKGKFQLRENLNLKINLTLSFNFKFGNLPISADVITLPNYLLEWRCGNMTTRHERTKM